MTENHSSWSFERRKEKFLERIRQLNETTCSPIFLPTNVAVRIFSFVSREDLENCKLVCKQWNWLIEYGGKALQIREIDVLILSSCQEFSIVAHCKSRVQKYIFKKYFKDRDIKGAIDHINHRNSATPFPFRFSCGRRVLVDVSINEHFPNFGEFHERSCKQFNRPVIYNRGLQSGYTSKLFTPPLVFYERLQWLLTNCTVKLLILNKFTLTDFFVEKFREFLPSPFCVDQLTLHCCRLRSIHTEIFQEFLGDVIHAKKYFLENLRYVLPNHINGELLKKDAIKKANLFYVGHALNRFNIEARFNVDDDDFINFVKSLLPAQCQIDTKTNSSKSKSNDLVVRKFFGILNSRITQDSIKRYKKIYTNAGSLNQKYLYEHLLFGDRRFLSPSLEAISEAVRQQLQNANGNLRGVDELDNADDDDDPTDNDFGDVQVRNEAYMMPFL